MNAPEAWAELRKLAEQALPNTVVHMEGWWLAVWPFRPMAAKVLAGAIAKVHPELAEKAAELARLVKG